MIEGFKVGDKVTWNSEAGHVRVPTGIAASALGVSQDAAVASIEAVIPVGALSGTIIREHTSDVDREGHTNYASPEAPQYDIKSNKTEHIAMHKGAALTRLHD